MGQISMKIMPLPGSLPGGNQHITPKTLVVPPSLEEAALKILNTEFGSGGESNPWKGTADLIVTPYLA